MFDIGVPVIISVCISFILYLFEPSLKNILAAITSVNTVALAVIAILAGFNTSSLALVAIANKEAFQKLYVAGAEPQERNVLKQVITFFAFAVTLSSITRGTEEKIKQTMTKITPNFKKP